MSRFIQQLSAQFDELKRKQPLLEMQLFDRHAVISGSYCVRIMHEGHEYLDLFSIEAVIPEGFPDVIPCVKEVGGKIKRNGFEHIYSDRTLCLEVDTRIKIELEQSPFIVFFFETFVTAYFFSYLYFRKNHRFPFGERSHDKAGYVEMYRELLEVTSDEAAITLLGYICMAPIKGHHPCPCLSGKRYRNCHRPIINKWKISKHVDAFKSDYAFIKRG